MSRAQPATVRASQVGGRRSTAWLAEEACFPADPFLVVKAPMLAVRVVEPLTDDELRALLAACRPPTGATPWWRCAPPGRGCRRRRSRGPWLCSGECCLGLGCGF